MLPTVRPRLVNDRGIQGAIVLLEPHRRMRAGKSFHLFSSRTKLLERFADSQAVKFLRLIKVSQAIFLSPDCVYVSPTRGPNYGHKGNVVNDVDFHPTDSAGQ